MRSFYFFRNVLAWVVLVQFVDLKTSLFLAIAAVTFAINYVGHSRFIGVGYSLSSGAYHGKLSGNSVELNLRGTYFVASLSVAHSLKRPQILEDHERPLYFRVEVFY